MAKKPPVRRRAKPPPRPRPSDIWPLPRRPWGAYLLAHARVARESLRYISTHLGTTLLVWLLIGIALFLPAAFHLLETNLARAAGGWHGAAAGFSMYLPAGTDAETATALATRFRREQGVVNVQLVTPEQALAEFRRHNDLDDVLDTLGTNPLPTTIRVALGDDVAASRLTILANRARRNDAVEEVVAETTWLERLAAIRDAVERLSWLLAALVGVGAVLVAAASVRLAIESRLAEVRVLVLVGANKRFVRRPFLYLGVVYGIGGGTVAGMLVAGGLAWLEAPLMRVASSYGGGLELTGFDPMFMAALLTSGALLGVLGAVVASNQRLKGLAVA